MLQRPLLVGLGALLVLLGGYLLFTGFPRPSLPEDETVAAVRVDGSLEAGDTQGDGPGWAMAGGVLLAAGCAAIGIGIGRWGRPRAPHGEADFTGPGEVGDHRNVPPTV